MTSEGRNDPKVKCLTRADSDFTAEVDVELTAGQHIYATRDPIWLSEGLTGSSIDGGSRWESPSAGTLRFGTGVGAMVVPFESAADGSALVVATELILLWTGDLRFGSPDLPGISGLATVSGDGKLWMLAPGYRSDWPHRLRSSRRFPAVVDPARLVWVRPGAVSLTPAPGPAGHPWLRLDPTATALLHTWPR